MNKLDEKYIVQERRTDPHFLRMCSSMGRNLYPHAEQKVDASRRWLGVCCMQCLGLLRRLMLICNKVDVDAHVYRASWFLSTDARALSL